MFNPAKAIDEIKKNTLVILVPHSISQSSYKIN